MANTSNVDQAVVSAICAGHPPKGHIRYADRLAACRALAADGYTDNQIAVLIRLTPRSVLRMRSERNIPGQPVGTNGYTRRHTHPLPMASQRGTRTR